MKYGFYRGFCSLGIVFQTMDNPHLRKALGMTSHQSGVLINRIQPTTSTAQVMPCSYTCKAYYSMQLTCILWPYSPGCSVGRLQGILPSCPTSKPATSIAAAATDTRRVAWLAYM